MSDNSEPVVKRAIELFKQGDYPQAKRYYEQAASEYGSHLFASSIRLCERRMAAPVRPQQPERVAPTPPENGATARQLAETQQLLEHYYTRYQEATYQLQDRE
ncbi:MAG: hypothetical protein L0J54_10100 [Halomonas sp.]|nr:hypothetical protein [Halomonas sp.]MDN6298357.1 hypothetical protein [Halomonas sp.]MDN6315754.1 hypothetical protein [Halomonas sp.]MDN6337170.1 hypothetical protein [Halomonas sp.]